ncbi:hypothetical protein CK203_042090 [Vitis vinifera]|uniref:Uncharacterized protein n=1 Tax=Vitis vinifera TaxID=29760 RepID=A0A438HHH9_VITVI|nr:hypothetical protein CK203_096970 [Vitis vinifera]RVW83878.1 hypothetical protein CK203_042090 [Vitis vinifera]
MLFMVCEKVPSIHPLLSPASPLLKDYHMRICICTFRNDHRYTIASISPSRVNPLIGVDSSYEILCKAFSDEAKAKLEVCFIPFCC